MHDFASYGRVFYTFARNSLVRNMIFRTNFLIEAASALTWMLMNLGFYLLVFQYTNDIAGWNKFQFFGFMATTMMVNSLVATFFMPNAAEVSDLVQNGGLDFALLKPIDAQFLVSLAKVDWSSLANFFFGFALLVYSLAADGFFPPWYAWVLYPVFLGCGVLILYSVMITLAAASIWMGRNQSLYDFWFYITIFSRYPMEIYESGAWGKTLQGLFTFIIPVLIVVNVPAQVVMKPMTPAGWSLAGYALFITLVSLAASRWVFQSALEKYRSASS